MVYTPPATAAAKAGTESERTKWARMESVASRGPRRQVALNITYTPIETGLNADAQLAMVRAGVSWLGSQGYKQWAEEGCICKNCRELSFQLI